MSKATIYYLFLVAMYMSLGRRKGRNMEAKLLEKTSISLDEIYKNIEDANKRHEYKVYYPHFVYLSDALKLELMRKGFKVYVGEWLHGDKGYIIEW